MCYSLFRAEGGVYKSIVKGKLLARVGRKTKGSVNMARQPVISGNMCIHSINE